MFHFKNYTYFLYCTPNCLFNNKYDFYITYSNNFIYQYKTKLFCNSSGIQPFSLLVPCQMETVYQVTEN